MARSGVASRIKIWRYNNLPTTPIPIDPTGPTTGYLTKRILLKAGIFNSGNVHLWDQSTSPGMYYELDASEEVELCIDSSLLILLSGSAAGQDVSVVMELQVGAT